jgi:hypothetical protein
MCPPVVIGKVSFKIVMNLGRLVDDISTFFLLYSAHCCGSGE